MLPGKGAGYTPLDLESNVSSGQWRTVEEHERLQQEGAILSTTATDSPESSGPEFADYYGQQRQPISSSRKKIAWIVGGGSGLAWSLEHGIVVPPSFLQTVVAFVVLCAVVAPYTCTSQVPAQVKTRSSVACIKALVLPYTHSHGRANTH